jgi:RsiW-degrading membrane proteinase PrsW (M82 family)
MDEGILAFDVLAAIIGSIVGVLVLAMAFYLRSKNDPKRFQPIVWPFIVGLAFLVISFVLHTLGHVGFVSEDAVSLVEHLLFIAAMIAFSLVIPRFHRIVLKNAK